MNDRYKQTDYKHLDDSQLWKKFKSGDRLAYAFIYQKYVQLLFNYGSKITKDRDLVKDCIQDLFHYLWTRREHLGETNNITYYLFKSLRRSIIMKISQASKEVEISLDYNFKIIPPHEGDWINDQSMAEDKKRLANALEKLPNRQKEAVFLKYYHNLSFEEIAAVMTINKRSVYKIIQKAIASLQKSVLTTLLSLFIFISQVLFLIIRFPIF